MSGFRITVESDGTLNMWIGELQDFVPKYVNRTIAREVIPAAERLLDRLIDTKLRPYPPPRPDVPFVWSLDPVKNARGRRGFFARYRNGFTRDGSLGRDWEGYIDFRDNTVTTSISNKNPGASYTLGSPSHNYAQVPSHALLWDNINDSVPPVLVEVGAEIDDGIDLVVTKGLEKVFKA